MSFADSVREELLSVPVRHACCRKVLVLGLLIDADREGKEVAFSCRSREIANFAAEQIRRQFGGRSPDIQSTSPYGHKTYVLTFSSSAVSKILEACDSASVLPKGGQAVGQSASAENLLGFSCEGCASAFLRGVFLTAGTLNDPHKSTHLEFLLRNRTRADFLSAYLDSAGYRPGVIHRAGGTGLYFKDTASVEDLVTMSGAVRTVMDMMNIRIEREIRNQENRATNCVAKNIEKSVSAAARQVEAIEKLVRSGMLEQFPVTVRNTARLRAEHPDATLEELRMLHQPPITKSGLNHRLQKLLEAADRLK